MSRGRKPARVRPALDRTGLVLVEKIVSGGQTGVDRAALDVALAMGIECGGWCPRHRRAEDGRIPDRYPLSETASAAYKQRTQRNVRDSDATLILLDGQPRGGTLLTQRTALERGKLCLLVDLSEPIAAGEIRTWLSHHGIHVLNVAGPRESQSPGIMLAATRLLHEVFSGQPARGSSGRPKRG